MLVIRVAGIHNSEEDLRSYGCYAIVNNSLFSVLTPHDQEGQQFPQEGTLRFIVKSTSKASQVLRSPNIDLESLPESGTYKVPLSSGGESHDWELEMIIGKDLKEAEQAEPFTEHLLLLKAENEQLKARLSQAELNCGRLETKISDMESEIELTFSLVKNLREEISEKDNFIKVLEEELDGRSKYIELLEQELDHKTTDLDLKLVEVTDKEEEETPAPIEEPAFKLQSAQIEETAFKLQSAKIEEKTLNLQSVQIEEPPSKSQSARHLCTRLDIDSLLDLNGLNEKFSKVSDGIYKYNDNVVTVFVRDKKLYVKERGRTLGIADFIDKKNQERTFSKSPVANKSKNRPLLSPTKSSARALPVPKKKNQLS